MALREYRLYDCFRTCTKETVQKYHLTFGSIF